MKLLLAFISFSLIFFIIFKLLFTPHASYIYILPT